MPRSSSTIRWQHKDGNYIWVDQRLVPVLDKAGKLIAIESIARDVTSRILADQKIHDLYEKEKAQRQELEEEARARGQFIDVLAHELRTPLTPVLITMQALHDVLKPSDDIIKAKLIKSAFKGTSSLAARLEELLDLARFSRGAFKLNMQPVNARELLENAAGSFIPALVPKRQSLNINVDPDLPNIEADRSRLEQVITNLLSNASKYSPEGTEITVIAREEDQKILVEIKDQGIGISSADQQRLFQPYHRVEQDRQSFPGIGLGLAVSKQIVEAHQGRIWIESERGKGSIFKFTIPIEVKMK
jgi:signal transduction histidine kinase